MAERPAVTSRPFLRSELTQLLGGNTRLLRAFEALSADVADVLPGAVLGLSQRIDALQSGGDSAGVVRAVADEAMDAAEDAQADAIAALLRAAAALEAATAAAFAALDANDAAHGVMPQIAQLREQISGLSRRLDDIEQGPPNP